MAKNEIMKLLINVPVGQTIQIRPFASRRTFTLLRHGDDEWHYNRSQTNTEAVADAFVYYHWTVA